MVTLAFTGCPSSGSLVPARSPHWYTSDQVMEGAASRAVSEGRSAGAGDGLVAGKTLHTQPASSTAKATNRIVDMLLVSSGMRTSVPPLGPWANSSVCVCQVLPSNASSAPSEGLWPVTITA